MKKTIGKLSNKRANRFGFSYVGSKSESRFIVSGVGPIGSVRLFLDSFLDCLLDCFLDVPDEGAESELRLGEIEFMETFEKGVDPVVGYHGED